MKEYFVNDRYRVIICMAKREIMVGDKGIIKLSQQEIADMLKMTKVKVNSIIRELKRDGYLIQCSLRGQYVLTEKAKKELEFMKIEEEI